MTKQKKVQVGHRNLKPGERVVQSRSLQCFIPNGEGFPWEVVDKMKRKTKNIELVIALRHKASLFVFIGYGCLNKK